MENEKQVSDESDEVKSREEALQLIRDNMEQIRQQALLEAQRYQATQIQKSGSHKRTR